MSERMSAVDNPADVLVYHQRAGIKGCHCGWSVLGASHPDHLIDVLRESGWDVVRREPRVFRPGDEEPDGVRAVLDYLGMVWVTGPTGWCSAGGRLDDQDWYAIQDNFGPLVEVVLPEPVLE